jgi:hypothetical protein
MACKLSFCNLFFQNRSVTVEYLRKPMQRLTARILFLTALLGTFVPVALAVAAPAPHACCVRKPHGANSTQFQAVSRPENCCPPRTPSVWAAPISARNLQYTPLIVTVNPPVRIQRAVLEAISGKPARAPPAFSIA